MADISGVERKVSFLHLSNKPPDDRPHTRVDDEAAVERKYSIGRELGRGSFGLVREVTSRVTGEKFAVKIVNKDKPGSSSILMLAREVEVLKRLDHPHIIKLIEILESSQKMYLVMELCTGGELTTILKLYGHFGEQEAKQVMRQLAEVLVYLHDNDIVHRDLKLENVLLKSPHNSSDSDKFVIKVTDFGLAHMRTLSEVGDPIMDQRCGTPYYMAPEVIISRHEYTKMCDVWSLGVIMYYILCGKMPFHSDAGMKLEDCIIKGTVSFRKVQWTTVSEQAQTLIQGMLCKDTTRRLTALRVLNDAWFTGQTANFLNAIDLMKDMTDDGSCSGSTTLSPHTQLDPVPETTKSSTHHTPSHHHHRTMHHSTTARSPHHHLQQQTQQQRSLAEKRSKSSTLSNPAYSPTPTPSPASCQLKHASTSSLTRSPVGKRSLSVGTRPVSTTPHPRKTSTQNTHTGDHQSDQQRRTSTVTNAAQHNRQHKRSTHSKT